MGARILTSSTLAAYISTAVAALVHRNQPAIRCDAIPAPEVLGAEIVSFSAAERHNVSGPYLNPAVGDLQEIFGMNICEVRVALTHPGIDNEVGFQIWLPLEGWNRRFLANGGGGIQAGYPDTRGLHFASDDYGFATGVTDGGVIADPNDVFLDDMISNGRVDHGRLADFSFRALHELSIVGKAVTKSYYGVSAGYSYWHGCSQGGRQGYMMAQRYPNDFDGILAHAPVIYLPEAVIGMGWGELTQRRLNYQPSVCIYNAFSAAAVKACDGLDGVIDDVISNIDACHFDPYSLVNQTVNCEGNSTVTISSEDAKVMTIIKNGPRSSDGTQLYPGWNWGTSVIDTTVVTTNHSLWDSWLTVIVNKDPDYDVSGYTKVEQFSSFLALSQSEFDGIAGTGIPDLTAFRDSGGKLLTYHGLADQLLPAANTIRYRESVEAFMGGNELVNDFYRLFLPPGLAHCSGGTGPFPDNTGLDALMQWVEEGVAPDVLHGRTGNWGGARRTRIICPYPLVDRYDGDGDPDDASSYSCAEQHLPSV